MASACPADASVSHTTLNVIPIFHHSTANLQSVSCTIRDRDLTASVEEGVRYTSLTTTTTAQANTQARAGALMAQHPVWVGHHTRGSRSKPTVHLCPLRWRGCGLLTSTPTHNNESKKTQHDNNSSEVVGGGKDSQQTQPKINNPIVRTRRPVLSEQQSGSSVQEIENVSDVTAKAPMKEQSDLFSSCVPVSVKRSVQIKTKTQTKT